MIELKPAWCVDDKALLEAIELDQWKDGAGKPAATRDGDDWSPGEGVLLKRTIRLKVPQAELRRRLDLQAGAVVGVAARWTCRSTASAGVHDNGPQPLPLIDDIELSLSIPPTIAGSIELETCIVVSWRDGAGGPGRCPDGGLVWSDGWSAAQGQVSVILEGSEFRIPVQTISFKERFGEQSDAVWSIGVDARIELEDLLANVATIYLNHDVLSRDFRGQGGEPDASLLPAMASAGINSDLLRLLTGRLRETLLELSPGATHSAGTVGEILIRNLTGAFDSLPAAIQSLDDDPSRFMRAIWSHFAPTSWAGKR